jgi:pimeloyl-ACP methyl ester carboxylesterase
MMWRNFCFRSLNVGALFLCLIATTQTFAATSPCRIPDSPQEVQCGQVERALDPARPDGTKIAIHFVVVPSQDRNKLLDAVFLLPGGPGQSAINVAGWGKTILSRLNRRRDLVFVDQRGTGRSAPLTCLRAESAFENETEQMRQLQACRKQLQTLPHGDLRMYSTSIAVQDLEAVRVQQGYAAINLVGVSYGTRVGLEYLRQYPSAVRRMVLDGVVPPDLQISAAADAQAALDALFADCAAEASCNQAYPQLKQSWQQLLNAMPRQASVIHPRLGTSQSVTITRDMLLQLVVKALYAPTYASALPYAITQAVQNNFSPLLTLSGAGALPGPGDIATGMHFSVMCSEDFSAQRKAVAVAKNDDFAQRTSSMYQTICADWPRAVIPPEFYSVPTSSAPVLLLAGGIDPVTPVRHASRVAQALGSKARLIEVKNAGHGLLTLGCVSDVAYRYLNAKSDEEAQKVDAQCVRQIPRPLAWIAPH